MPLAATSPLTGTLPVISISSPFGFTVFPVRSPKISLQSVLTNSYFTPRCLAKSYTRQHNTRSPCADANFFLPLVHCVLWAANSLSLLLRGHAPCELRKEARQWISWVFMRLARQDWLLPSVGVLPSVGASCIIPQESRGIVLWQGHTKKPQDGYTK